MDEAPSQQAFAAWASTLTVPAALLSSEAFCFLRTDAEAEALRALFGQYFTEIIPVIVIRDRPSWSASWERQLDTMGVLDRIRALPVGDRVIDDWYFDTGRLTQFWSCIGPMRTVSYTEAMRAAGSVLPAILAELGLEQLALRQDYFANVTA